MNNSFDYNTKLLKNINEVSLITGIKKHVLRHWEKRINELDNNILSIKKGRDGRRRYYRDADIVVLKKIRYLMQERNYTIKGAVNEIKSDSKKSTNNELSTELKIISRNLRELINN